MKKILSVIALLAVSGSCVWAQQKYDPIRSSDADVQSLCGSSGDNEVLVPKYAAQSLKKVPFQVLAIAPKDAVSHFYGSTHRVVSERQLLIHFYSGKNPAYANKPSGDYYVDVFATGSNKADKKLYFLSRTRFDYRFMFPSGIENFDKVKVSTLWLNCQNRVPIIKLDLTDTRGFYGPFGCNVLLVYSHGLIHTAVVQSFNWGWSTSHGERPYFDTLDERGLLMVRIVKWDSGAGDSPVGMPQPAPLKWNGQKFVEVK